MSERLYTAWPPQSKSCKSSATSASAISVFTLLSDKSVSSCCKTTLPVSRSRGSRARFVVRDSS